jgi:hypothetical protein
MLPSTPSRRDSVRSNRDREIIRLREQGLTLREIGNRYGLTRERIRQITTEAGVTPGHVISRQHAAMRRIFHAVAVAARHEIARTRERAWINVRFSQDLLERFVRLVALHDRSFTREAIVALEQYIQNEEATA